MLRAQYGTEETGLWLDDGIAGFKLSAGGGDYSRRYLSRDDKVEKGLPQREERIYSHSV